MPFLIIEDSSIGDPWVANPQEAHVLVDLENALSVLDAIGACKFMGILLTAEEIVSLISAAAGVDFRVEDFRLVATGFTTCSVFSASERELIASLTACQPG